MQTVCIDEFLWSLYLRTPKIDTIKVPEKQTISVKRKGKMRTVTRTVMKPASEDFSWKDPVAAQKAGLSLKDYVIGGMDPTFKAELYLALRASDDAGLEPGITSAFRDDFRQSIAAGRKARSDESYHGGSRRGGYGHGLAADIVSVKGDTRAERFASSVLLWSWIDTNGKDFGIGRPYLGRDAPHVGPLDGQEFVEHRGGGHPQRVAGMAAKRPKHHAIAARLVKHYAAATRAAKRHAAALEHTRKVTKHIKTARFWKARSG